MDINDVRNVVTVFSLVMFIGLVIHTWSRRRGPEHADAALLPFIEDEAFHEAEATTREKSRE